MTLEALESDTFSKDCRSQIRELSRNCFEVLRDLLCVVDDFKALPINSQRSWGRMGFESNKLPDIEERLRSITPMVSELNQTLSRYIVHITSRFDKATCRRFSSGSMNQLAVGLNHLVDQHSRRVGVCDQY
jgi:hypothetical protein